MVWVKGHCRDQGNTTADLHTEEGCANETEHFNQAEEMVWFYQIVTVRN